MMGTALMATGTVLYLVKRRQKSQVEFGRATPRVYRCFEAINIAVIAGCAVACIGYFYGNWLLLTDIAARPTWEIRVFLLVWLATFVHAALRPNGGLGRAAGFRCLAVRRTALFALTLADDMVIGTMVAFVAHAVLFVLAFSPMRVGRVWVMLVVMAGLLGVLVLS